MTTNEIVFGVMAVLASFGFAVMALLHSRLRTAMVNMREEIKAEALKNGTGDNVYDLFVERSRVVLNLQKRS